MNILEVIEEQKWSWSAKNSAEHNASLDRIAEAARGLPVLKKVVKPFKPYEWDVYYTCPCGGFNLSRDQVYCQHCGAGLDWSREDA